MDPIAKLSYKPPEDWEFIKKGQVMASREQDEAV